MKRLALALLPALTLSFACGPKEPAATERTYANPAVSPSSTAPLPTQAPGDAVGRLIEQGQYDAAKKEIDARIAKEPNNAEAWAYKGIVSEKLGDLPAAEGAYRKALELNPALAAAAENLSAIYIDTKKYAQAVAIGEAIVAKQKETGAVLLNLAIAHAELGNGDKATLHFTSAKAKSPNDAYAAFTYGHWLGAWKKSDEAKAELSRAATLTKNDVEGRPMLASIGHEYRGIGAFQECEGAFTRAIGVKDADELRTERGLCLLGLNQGDKALEDLEAAVALDPNFTVAHYYLGGRYASLGKLQRGIDSYTRFIELSKDAGMKKEAAARIEKLKSALKKAPKK